MSTRESLEDTERDVARGDAPDTPLFVIAGVAVVIATVAALGIAIALLVSIFG